MAIFLSMYLPANLPGSVSINLSTHCQSRAIHRSLDSLALRAHSNSTTSDFSEFVGNGNAGYPAVPICALKNALNLLDMEMLDIRQCLPVR